MTSPRSSGWTSTAYEWLESPYLARLAARVAHSYGLPTQAVPDLLQELRIALWKAGPNRQFNVTWLVGTAGHKAIDVKRRSRTREKNESRAGDSGAGQSEGDPELLHLLRARVSGMPATLRRFYRLRFTEGLSEREIASKLGLCRSSVRCLERRCRRMVLGAEERGQGS